MTRARPAPSRWRWVRRFAAVAVVAGLGGAAGVALGLAWLVSPAGNDAVARWGVAWLDDQVPGTIRLGRLRTDLWRTVTLDDLALDDATGAPLLRVAHVEATIDPWALADGRVSLPTVAVTGFDATLAVSRDGRLGLLDALGVDPEWITRVPAPIQIGSLAVNGRATVDLGGFVVPVDALDLTATVDLDHALAVSGLTLGATLPFLRDPLAVGGGFGFDGADLTLDRVAITTGPSAVTLDGGVDDLFGGGGAQVAAKLTSVDVASLPVFDRLGLRFGAAGDASVTGPWRDLAVIVALPAPAVGVEGGIDLTDPAWPWRADVALTALDAHTIAATAPQGTILSGHLGASGTLTPDALGAAGTFDGDLRALGLRFDGVQAAWRVDGDALVVTDGHVAGPAGTATFAGRAAPLLDPVVALDADAALHLDQLRPVGVPDGLSGEAIATVHLAGPLLAAGADVTGDVALADVAFRGLTLPTATARLDGHVDPTLNLVATATVAAPEVDGKGLALRGLEAPLAVTWAPNGALVARGTGRAEHASFAAWADVDGAVAALSLTAAPKTAIRADAVVTLPNPRASAFQLGDVVAHASLVGDDATTRVTVALPDLPPVEVQARVDLAHNALIVDALTLTPPQGPAWTLAAPATATLAPEGLTDLDARLVSSRGEARLTGRLGWDGLAVTAVATGLDVDVVSDWLPGLGWPELEGRVSVKAEVTGRENLAADAEFFAAGVGFQGGPGDLELDGVAHLHDDVARLDVRVAHGNTPIATVVGALPVRIERDRVRLDASAPLHVDAVVAAVPIADLVEIVRSEPLSALAQRWVDGDVRADVHLDGPLEAPAVSGQLGGRVLGPAGWVTGSGVLSGDLGRVVVRGKAEAEDLGRIGGAEATLTTGLPALIAWGLGQAPRPERPDEPSFWLPEAKAVATAKRLPLQTAAGMVGLRGDVGGTVDATLTLAGRGFDVVPALTLALDDARFGDQTTMPAGRLTLTDAGAFDAVFDFRYERPIRRGSRKTVVDEGGIALHGTIPLHVAWNRPPDRWFEDPMHVAITGRGVPIAVATALDAEIVDPEGWLAIVGTVDGTPSAPNLDLHADLADGSVRYRRLGIRAEDLDVDVDVTGDRVEVRDVSLLTRPARRGASPWLGGDEGVVVHGTARIGAFDLVDLDIDAVADHAIVLSRRDQSARVSTVAPLHLAGRATKPVITGSIRVDQAFVDLDKGTLMEAGLWEGAPSVVDPRIRVVRGGVVEAREVPSTRPFWAFVDADVHVDLGQDTQGGLALPYLGGFGALAAEASTIEAAGVLAGAVDVAAHDGTATVTGRVDVVRGDARVMKSEFLLDAGTVTFVDGDPFQPFVVVSGGMDLDGGVNIDLNLRGTPTGAEARFHSAQLASDDQVIAAVISGKNPATGASNLDVASGLATSVLSRVFFGDLDLGTLQFTNGVVSYTFAPNAQLRITPEIGLGTMFTGDALALDASWRPTRDFTVYGRLGTYSRHVGVDWRRRY